MFNLGKNRLANFNFTRFAYLLFKLNKYLEVVYNYPVGIKKVK
tara:strand:+ start:370 stop:498 length:129 start_codon:yes stop_codon:yes gene_type:complete